MDTIIYTLCALTSVACAVLLWRSIRPGSLPLLFWSAVCFALLAVSNLVLVLDKVFLPAEVDLRVLRYALTLVAVGVLLFGLIWEED